MAGKRSAVPYRAPAMADYPYGGNASRGGDAVERYRPRTPAETANDAYGAVVQVTTLNTITHMSYDSVRTMHAHRQEVLTDYPGSEAELNALAFNHVQGLLGVQRQVTDNTRREKS